MAYRSLIQTMPDGLKPEWSLTVDGVSIPWARKIVISNERFGTLTVGKSPNGPHDQCALHEAGGGGCVIVPYAVLANGHVLIGVLSQMRRSQDRERPVLNVPRGYLQPGETPLQAAMREFVEEIGAYSDNLSIHTLNGVPVNINSGLYETWDRTSSGEPEGIRYYGIKFPEAALQLQTDASGAVREATLAPGVVTEDATIRETKSSEDIFGVSFIPWHAAAALGDAFTLVATLRVLATLHSGD